MRVGAQSEMQSVVTRDQTDAMQTLPGVERDADGEALRLAGARHADQHAEAGRTRPNVQVRGDVARWASRSGRASRSSTGRMFNVGHERGDRLEERLEALRRAASATRSRRARSAGSIVGIFDAPGSAVRFGDLGRRREPPAADEARHLSPRSSCALPDADAADRIIATVKGDQRVKLEGKTEKKYYDEQMVTGAPIKSSPSSSASSRRSAPRSAR